MNTESEAHVVLILDDEPLFRLTTRDALEDGGYLTHEAASADEALDILEDEGFSAVVTDIEMPGEYNGLDLAWVVDENWPRVGS